jgi:hypothetical protein
VPYRERLTPPPLWWVIGGLVAATFPIAVLFYLGPVWAAGVAVLAIGAVLLVLLGWAAIVIRLDGAWLSVGRARIELGYLAGARALDADATQARSGVDADARAYLVLRPYIRGAVELTLDDADDPVPYWLVSTRRPRALSAAIGEAISSRVTG